VPNLLENVDLLHDLLLTVRVLHEGLVYRLDSDVSPRQLVDAKHDLTKCSFSDEFNKLVELKGSGRHLSVFLEVLPIIVDQLVSFLHN